jgi:hypothetical protein
MIASARPDSDLAEIPAGLTFGDASQENVMPQFAR